MKVEIVFNESPLSFVRGHQVKSTQGKSNMRNAKGPRAEREGKLSRTKVIVASPREEENLKKKRRFLRGLQLRSEEKEMSEWLARL